MAKPVMLTVDDDPEVLRAVSRDLRRKYGEGYRIVRADSGTAGLQALEELKLRNEPAALLLVDQRMPQMSGVEFLQQAMALYPDAKRVLLTAYADTEAAIRAINGAHIDYYLLKPWDPPEEELYPVLDDLLAEWRSGYRPPFEGVRVIGHRYSPECHAIKDFLGRNLVPYRWLDVETSPEAVELLALAGAAESPELPVVILADGQRLVRPALPDLAARIGLRTQAERPFYDLAIVGGGPAGLAAAVYGASEGLRTLLIEREAPGGQAGTSSRIENYLGFPSGLSGSDLARRGVTQAQRFGAELVSAAEAVSIRPEGTVRLITLADGSTVSAKAVIVASGVTYRKLDVPGAAALTGRGVYYGAARTEAVACRDQDVYIVGGGNSAGQAAIHFAQYARSVHIVCRGSSLARTMSQYLIEQIDRTPCIEVHLGTAVSAVHGDERLEAVTIRCDASGTEERVPAAALFIFIGADPHTDWLGASVRRDSRGFILTGPELIEGRRRPDGWPLDRDPYLLETSIPGVFAAGDVRRQSVKRVASAVGEGSIAVQFVHQYLATL